MSDPNDKNPSRASRVLDDLVREAKSDLEPRLDDAAFSAMEDRILARMAKEPSPLVDDVRNAARAPSSSGRGRALRVGALVLAAAAAVAVVMKRDPGTALVEGPAVSQTELTASSLKSTEGGVVRVGGQAVSAGHALRAGDVLEVDAARAVLERPRKVTWLLEAREDQRAAPLARARVKSAGESLVLGLEDGAIEAQVTPVPSGEAFAVDVAAGTSLVRVAVHGTHLRVARNGSRVTVDLTEGVVSIGVPPRTGSTYGTLVTAPSHVEFDATNLDATLRIDHAPAAVRAPVPLSPHEAAPSGAVARTDTPVAPPAVPAPGAPGAVPAPGTPATVPRPASVPRPAADPSRVEAPAKLDPTKPALPPREAIAAAVRDCAPRSRGENVKVTVSSSLKLKMAAGGTVETATFDPPLLPEIQTCAAVAIYKTKLEDGASGTVVTIPIDFSY